jgi:hypothetical protein
MAQEIEEREDELEGKENADDAPTEGDGDDTVDDGCGK